MSVKLFEPIRLRGLTIPNRIVVAPMTQFSSPRGVAGDWHFVHLGQYAASGAGLVLTESTYVCENGRNTLNCLGLYNDEQEQYLSRICRYYSENSNTAFGVQLCHAGRKASCRDPSAGGGPLSISEGGFQTVAPSAIAPDDTWPSPMELTESEITDIIEAYSQSAVRAVRAGAKVVELHGAHGYLIHQFLSPLSNHRRDAYGGSFERRIKFASDVFNAVREAVNHNIPIGMRISATDWIANGWDIEQSVMLLKQLQLLGLDYVHVSSGGLSRSQKIEVGPGYQVPFAARLKSELKIAVIAVGQITKARQAEAILKNQDADLVALARAMIFNPHWPMAAAYELGAEIEYPHQYERGHPDNWSRPGINSPGNQKT